MQTVTSFQASAVPPDQLRGIMADYLELERARIFRRLLVTRLAVLTPIVAVVSFFWLSTFALWISVGLCVAVATWAWTVELGHERRLARRLDEVPSDPVPAVESDTPRGARLRKKVIKSP